MAWSAKLEAALTRAWQSRSGLSIALLPVAALYKLLESGRRHLFALGILPSQRLPVPVVIVGNVIAGGAGKTPTLIAIAEALAHRGYHIGVISRGYGRVSSAIVEVLEDSPPATVGDEPLMIRRRLGCPVFVGSRRVEAALALLKCYPNTNLIVCDDGLQHLHLYRDVEVYVFDDRGVGNGWPLPAGPLRSDWPPFHVGGAGQSPEKTVVLHTGSHPCFAGYRATRSFAPLGILRDGSEVPLMRLRQWDRPLVAVAGIAQPDSFFAMLAAERIPTIRNIPYPDHFNFQDWAVPADSTVLCTEKDAAKVWLRCPTAIAIPLIQRIEPALLERVCNILRADRCSV